VSGADPGGAVPAGAARATLGYRRCTVIGGAGMLGFEMVKQLLAAGKQVRILDLEDLPEPICEAVRGDIRSRADVAAACSGAEVVFQTAAAVWDPRTPARVYDEVNVRGNRHVLDVCRELGIERLVYTSTIDVVVDGRKPVVYGDESLPYPKRMPRDPYCRTKIEAEQMVLAADGPDLAVCALRPVGMYGPRDRYHLAGVLAMARKGNRFRLGDGSARFSHAYSENVAYAHLVAAEHLFPGSKAAGQVYFIGDHYPARNFFDFMDPYLGALGLPAPRRRVPYPVAYALATVVERLAPRSNFNRFAVVQTCVDHTYRDDKARCDLGYAPIVPADEAFRRTVESLER